MYNLIDSNITDKSKNTKFNIVLFQQFFIHKERSRHLEICYCLKKNIQLKLFSKIYQLVERVYTKEEMNLTEDEYKSVKQIEIKKRMTYSDVFKTVKAFNVNGYFVIANSDIFFDDTISNLNKTNLSDHKSLVALLRYEFNPSDRIKHRIFGPRPDSQDVWIFHSNNSIEKSRLELFDFMLGKPGCDNKLLYLFYMIGYKIYNEPNFIKTYHYHVSSKRDYTNADLIPSPYLSVFPSLNSTYGDSIQSYIAGNSDSKFMNEIYANKRHVMNYKSNTLNNHESNIELGNYIASKLEKKEQFIIPRIAGVEHIIAMTAYKYIKNGNVNDLQRDRTMTLLESMNNNAGINIKTLDELLTYTESYVNAFKNAELYAVWEQFSNVYMQSDLYSQAHDSLTKLHTRKKYLSSFGFDIFHHIYNNPWTQSLKGKRILIVSSFVDTIQKQLLNMNKIYGVDLFPDCKFVFVRPPQTNCGNNNKDFNWIFHFKLLCIEIQNKKDEFDVALCSCGGYGIPLLNFIHQLGKSAVYVGGVLQMYFGIIGNRWEKERPDVLKIFKNQYWTRPLASEIPQNKERVEGGCYW